MSEPVPLDEGLPHRELDGENTAEETEAFLRRVESDPVLRTRYETLVWLKAALARLAPVTPPFAFGRDVMNAVRRSAAGRRQGWLGALRAPFVRRPAFGYALAAAAGIVAGAFLGPLAPHVRVSPGDGSAAGTILPEGRLEERSSGLRQPLTAEGVRGEIVAIETGGKVFAEVRLESEGPFDLTLGFDPETLAASAFERRGPAPGAVSLEPGDVLLKGVGAGRYTLTLDRRKGGPWQLRVSLAGKNVRVERVLEGKGGS